MRLLSLLSLLCLLLAALARGQAAPPAAPVPAVIVGPDDPVITINGFCAGPVQGDACKTVITRAQFEKLIEALQPGMSPSLRLNVANAYARNLKMSAAAEKRGLDKTPAFEEEMRYARMQLLAQDLDRALRADANNILDADVEASFKKNQSSYEQATVARIFVPHAKRLDPATDPAGAQPNAGEEDMAKLAASLRARAANGENPDKLQLEAYAQAGEPRTTVNTRMEKVRRATLPPQHEKVMDLMPGEVSEVFSDPDGAHFVYKMISKQIPPLEEVRAEIHAAISTQRYRESIKPFQGDVVFSDAYFVSPRNTDAASPHSHSAKRKKQPAEPGQNHD
jgi:hypothetical protein